MMKLRGRTTLKIREEINMVEITVPASSANVGPGFDSAGIALSRYLTLTVEKAGDWKFSHTNDVVPEAEHYKDHYIYITAHKIADWYNCTLQPCHIKMHSEIPLARGLGSSA